MDLSKLDTTKAAEQGTFLHLHSQTGRPLYTETDPKQEIGIVVLGKDSKRIKKEGHRISNARISKTQSRGFRAKKTITSEEIEEGATEICAAACVEFRNIVVDGSPVNCSKENAVKLFERFPWILAQVDERLNDDAVLLGE